MKKQLLNSLQIIEEQLKESRKLLKKRTSEFTSTKDILEPLNNVALAWFNDLEKYLQKSDLDNDVIDRYSSNFEQLLKLSSSNNRTKSFFGVVNELLKNFHDDLVIPLKTNAVTFKETTKFTELLEKIDDPEETEYISEAISCLENGFLKASVVLGWCAAIDKIHDKIDSLGYKKFNGATANMFGESKGRFKRFNKKYSINSLSELREVFDSDLLKVVEYMGLIDGNEHTRLRSCFDMRCHAAHPGDAPITEYNVLSFFSDIIEIILLNDEFKMDTQKA
jgi:hypothetical protein